MKKILLTVTTLALLAGASAFVHADDMDKMPGMNNQTNAPEQGTKTPAKPYPLGKCIVSDEKLGEMGKPVTLIYEGQEMKFCCKDCVKKFKKDPKKYIKLLDEETEKQKDKK